MYLKFPEGIYARVFNDKNGQRVIVRHAFGLLPGNKTVILSPESAFLLNLARGVEISKKELLAEFRRFFGKKINSTRLDSIISELKKNNLLADKKTEARINKLKDKFKRRRVRSALFGGIYYPKSAKDIYAQLKKFMGRTTGPSKLLWPQLRQGQLKAIIVPHSNLAISGECAAYAYNALARSEIPETIIILGPQHSGLIRYPHTVLKKDFRTVLGTLKVDKDFCDAFARNCRFDTSEYNIVHMTEHSIELQLLFLQYIFRAHIDKVRIVPILISSEESPCVGHDVFIDALKKTIKQSRKRTIIVATGDFLHCRPQYTYKNGRWHLTWLPDEKSFHACNKEVIGLLRNAEAKRFLDKTAHAHFSMCGRFVFYTLLKLISPAKGKLLQYTWTTNLKITRRKINSVDLFENIGFASMAFLGKP